MLEKLCAAHGVSGNEKEIRDLLRALCLEAGAECTVDRVGNLICVKDGGDASAPHILLAAHMDEAGFIITGARDDGLLCFTSVGKIDPRDAVSKIVSCGEKKTPGVIGAKAIHLQSAADRERVLSFSEMYIDIGAKDKAGAEALCPMGTYCVFESPVAAFGEDSLAGRALDNRASCMNLVQALQHGYRGRLTCAFTVQEEIGCRGALVLSRRLDNDLAIVLETSRANDLGDVKPEDRICMLGGGAVVAQMSRTSISHGALRAAIEQTAEKAGIPWQKLCGVQPASDMGRLQFGALAKPAASIAIPCRGSHSGNCILRRSDIAAQSALVNALLDALPEIYNDLTKSEVLPV